MSEQAKEYVQLLHLYCSEPWMTIGAKPFAIEAATLIEQQVARIAELESEITRARSLSDTEIELLRRAEAAEAEVKRLRKVLRKIELMDINIQYGGNIYDAKEFFGPYARLVRATLATQEPRHD